MGPPKSADVADPATAAEQPASSEIATSGDCPIGQYFSAGPYGGGIFVPQWEVPHGHVGIVGHGGPIGPGCFCCSGNVRTITGGKVAGRACLDLRPGDCGDI
ncbi:hypothetical protein Jiend_55690 [Micromonospora endophytica]|nr:hypothetical protein Jiend_55690 [Micromonospora endophytica]